MVTNHKSLILAISLFIALSASISATPGDLDLTFSGDGKLTDFLSRGDDFASGVAIQPDGKIVVAGSSKDDFAVARYNTDGWLDTSFGTDGRVTTDINFSYDYANAIAIQPDGKILVAGKVVSDAPHPDFAIVRYNSDGSLDNTFGSNGKVTTDIDSGAAEAYSVAIYGDGKIVAGGRRSTYDSGGTNDFAIVRYNSDGSLDTTFDSDGKVTTDFPSERDIAYSVAIQPDGKIVAAGRSHIPGSGPNFALVRYNVDGSLDSSFDGDGKVTTQVGSASSEAHSVAIQADGKIVAAGSAVSGFALVRYSSSGSVENVVITPYTNDTANSVAIQPDGKIVAAGPSGSNVAVVRFNADFSIDTTFGTNGRVTTPIFSYGGASGLAVQADGKIVGAGNSNGTSFDADFAVVRFNANGSLDTSFDGDGTVTTDFGFFQGNSLSDTAIQPDGKIVAAGVVYTSTVYGWSDFVLLRYNSDGSPDTTFGSGTGKVRTDMGSSGDQASAVAIQPDGKIVVAGSSSDYDGNSCCFALARYNVDGSLDATFGNGGRVITGGWGYSGAASDVVIQPDGKIVAAGYSNEFNWPNGGFAVYRYNSNGSLDTSFDGDGKVLTPIGSSYAVARDVAIQPDGKIVAAGVSEDGSGRAFAVVRYNGNGSLDTTFDGDGIVITQTSQHDAANSSVIQPDGKIIVAGSALIRYNGNGSLDTTFGTGGVVTTQVSLGSVALQSNGQIVASGTSSGIGSPVDFAVVRYNANGSLDTSFGSDGITTADFDNSTDNAYGLALDNAGRAVVVGVSDGRFAMARFLLGDPTPTCTNPIDCPEFFVRQHYRDFLNREPDAPGLAHWTGEITECDDPAKRHPGESFALCTERKTANTSAAFFLSPEFQNTGSFILRVYWGTLGKSLNAQCPGVPMGLLGHCRPLYSEYIADMATITQGIVVNDALDPARINANKQAFVAAFVQRPDFRAVYDVLNNTHFVDRLFQTTGISPSSGDRQALIDGLNSGAETRASVVFKIVDGTTTTTDGLLTFNTTYGQAFYNQEFDTAFVMMEYLGYLRRNPDQDGYDFWLAKLRLYGNWVDAQMVLAFIISPEYLSRFEP